MEPNFKKKAIIGIGLGIGAPLLLAVIVIIIVAGLEIRLSGSSRIIIVQSAYIVSIIGHILILCGCYYWAKGKGYSGVLGVFLGLFSILGIIILLALPDKYSKEEQDFS